MKGGDADSINTQCSPTIYNYKYVLPSAQSDSWSGDAIALHFLCRKLAILLINFCVGRRIRNEETVGYCDEGCKQTFKCS